MHHTSFEAIDSPANTHSIKLSAVIITFNEEDNIKRCLDSLEDIADEIVVVDAFSTDKTKKICEKKQVRFIQKQVCRACGAEKFCHDAGVIRSCSVFRC